MLAAGCLSLTGCDTKVGTAAVVNGHRITESGRGRPAGASPADPGQATERSALEWQIREQLFQAAFAKTGGMPSDTRLSPSTTRRSRT